ncbi:MAG: hypothetical protein RLZZ358_334 [Bacteroidota bacterium]|jgi:hypothetical protein
MLEPAKLFILYYKSAPLLPLEGFYAPLFCGNGLGKMSFPQLKDDTGIHISEKNEFYSELTGIYWVWKNTSQEITGFCHYRRYFTSRGEPWYHKLKFLLTHPFKLQRGPNPLIYVNSVKKYTDWILSQHEAELILEENDVILPRARIFKYSIKKHYDKYHSPFDLELIEGILQESYPEFVSTWHLVLEGKLLYANNMFILKSTLYQEFMVWWFDVLFRFERLADLESYKGYQRRILGFLGERLLTLWVIHKGLKVKELQLLYFKRFKSTNFP